MSNLTQTNDPLTADLAQIFEAMITNKPVNKTILTSHRLGK